MSSIRQSGKKKLKVNKSEAVIKSNLECIVVFAFIYFNKITSYNFCPVPHFKGTFELAGDTRI